MRENSLFLLVLFVLLPFTHALQAQEPQGVQAQELQNPGQEKQLPPEQLIKAINTCIETKGQQCPKDLAQQKAINDIKVREALAKAKEQGIDLSVDGKAEDIQQRLQELVQQEGKSPRIPSTPDAALRGAQGMNPPSREDLGRRQQRPQQPPEQGGQDLTQTLSGFAQLLQSVSQLIGVLKQPEQPTQLAQVPLPQPERETYKTCKDVGGASCNTAENTCSSEANTPDITSKNLVCCVGKCTPKSLPYKEAEKNVKAAENTPASPFQAAEKGKLVSAGPTNQDPSLLDKNTDTILTRTNTIDVLNKKTTNLYTLYKTQRGITNHHGIFLLDTTGEITLFVAEEDGALTMDKDALLLWLAPGVTHYDASAETYETSTRLFSPQLSIVLEPAAESVSSLTGAVAFSPPETGLTFGQGKLSAMLTNALDASLSNRDEVDYVLLVKGYENIMLLGDKGFFPLAIRHTAKGDTHIIPSLAVRQRYKVKDMTYEYAILPKEGVTQVKIPNGKVIEESHASPIKTLSLLQKSLLLPKST